MARTARHLVWLLCLLATLGGGRLAAEPQYWVYTVRPGDNIWDLTRKYCVSVQYWQQIQQINNVRLDRQIPPGSKLRFPLHLLKYQPTAAQVIKIRGEARLIRAGSGAESDLTPNTALNSGDRIVTAEGANVTLRFADGSELLVLEHSDVVMDTLSAWGTTGMVDTRVRLQGGRIDTGVKPTQGPGSRYQIITPAAVAAVRGTRFRVAAEHDAPLTRSEVTEGTVAVGDKGRHQAIPAGFGVVSESGKPPQAPRKLLPAPKPDADSTLQRQVPLHFSWSALQGAHGYRIQLAPDERFDTLIADTRVEQPEAHWPDLPDGHYAMRVRGIDAVGLEGLNGVQRFEVDARPLAPHASGMSGGMRVRSATPQFSWTPVGGVRGYRFELARDADFGQVLVSRDGDGDTLTLDDALAPGSYYWRLAAIDQDGGQGPYGETRHFVYRPTVGVPGTIAAPQITRNSVNFAWQSVAQAAAYQIQLAEDPDFTQLVAQTTVTAPQAQIARPPSQHYYYRVRAQDAHGEYGAFSAARELDVPPLNYWGVLILLLPLILAL